ncbi:hypothetical protein [Sphaerospermopsis reniformis]|uniref:hypothetical protein n=1 Tax=Sphaerospermopsis reniformis TaxID=531300 RepID=UPI0010F46A46|nr:hypothetical protein [Sphaerospermopsis reniformis]
MSFGFWILAVGLLKVDCLSVTKSQISDLSPQSPVPSPQSPVTYSVPKPFFFFSFFFFFAAGAPPG